MALAIASIFEKTVSQTGIKGAFIYAAFGLLAALALPPYGILPLIFLSFPFLIKGIDSADTKSRAFFVGFWFGFGFFILGLYWVGLSFLEQDNVPHWLAPFAVLGLAGTLAIFVGFATLSCRYFWSSSPTRLLVFATLWTVFEWLRGHLFTGLPWNLMSQIWFNSDVMMQSLSMLGAYGLSLLTLLLSALPVLLFDRYQKDGREVGGLIVVIFVGLVVFGFQRLERAEVQYYPDVSLRLVQANIAQIDKWKVENWSSNVNHYIALSRQPRTDGSLPTHIIWPETAMPYDLHANEDIREAIMGGLGGSALLTGVTRFERGEDSANSRLYNSIVALAPNGDIEATYDKFHLVPFGEYVPFAALANQLGLVKLTAGEVGFNAGDGPKTITINNLPPFSPLICYEIIFPSNVRADHFAQWILNVTNDAWFGESSGPYQHFAQVRMRAIEEGVAVVRVAGSGISAVIDPWGRPIAKLGLGKMGVLDSPLPKPIIGNTAYARFGDFMLILLMLFLQGFRVMLVKRAK